MKITLHQVMEIEEELLKRRLGILKENLKELGGSIMGLLVGFGAIKIHSDGRMYYGIGFNNEKVQEHKEYIDSLGIWEDKPIWKNNYEVEIEKPEWME
jgi:hypothetical protein